MGKIPSSYLSAEWRNTTPVDIETNRIGMGFDLSDGTVVRLSISMESARNMAETLGDYLMRYHSEISAGMPSVEVSIPLDGEKA